MASLALLAVLAACVGCGPTPVQGAPVGADDVTGVSERAPAQTGPEPDQDGPLVGGSEKWYPLGDACGQPVPSGGSLNLGEQVENRGTEPVEILSVELVEPENVEYRDAGAWRVDAVGVSYLWSDVEAGRHPEISRLVEMRRTAAGFVVRPGETVGVSATVEVLDASQRAAVRHLTVRYRSEGREYAEPTHVGYRIEPDGCE